MYNDFYSSKRTSYRVGSSSTFIVYIIQSAEGTVLAIVRLILIIWKRPPNSLEPALKPQKKLKPTRKLPITVR